MKHYICHRCLRVNTKEELVGHPDHPLLSNCPSCKKQSTFLTLDHYYGNPIHSISDLPVMLNEFIDF